MGDDEVRCGIDLGGTKIELIALAADGATLIRRRQPSPQGSYTATLDCLTDMVTEAERELGREMRVGVGIPGAPSRETNMIKNANSTWLIGHSVAADFSQRLGRPVRLANDANCFALSEAVDGAGQGADNVFGVILGTGVGGGLVVHRQLLVGANAIAGEWGHNPLPWPRPEETPGVLCYCGRRGCIETFLSGPGFARDFRSRGGEALTPAEIIAAADAGDLLAQAAFDDYVDRLARALAHVINIVDPAVIVLGGGMSNVAALYTAVPAVWARYIFSDSVRTQLRPPTHGDSSGVRGAAWL